MTHTGRTMQEESTAVGPTPGPWAYDGEGEITALDGRAVAFTAASRMTERDLKQNGPATANGHLISAAPVLLDAAKFAWAAMDSEEGRQRAKRVLLAAITKATTP